MKRELPRAIVLGGLVGILVIGGGARAAMRILALSAGDLPAFSWGGTFEVMLYFALPGVAAGLGIYILRRRPILLSAIIVALGSFAATILALPSHLEAAAMQFAGHFWLAGFLFFVPFMAAAFILAWMISGRDDHTP